MTERDLQERILSEIEDLRRAVQLQNGRVGRAEAWIIDHQAHSDRMADAIMMMETRMGTLEDRTPSIESLREMFRTEAQLLAAETALHADAARYQQLRRLVWRAGATVLTSSAFASLLIGWIVSQ